MAALPDLTSVAASAPLSKTGAVLPKGVIGPMMTRVSSYLDHDGPIAFAHRGGAGEWPENTMPAFANAVALGYRYVETDVHATSDGVLVAFHDDRLDRVTDREGMIHELTWSEVSRAKVAGSEPVPLLEDLLTTWPDLRINIDAKHDSAVEPLADVIRRTGALGRICVGSFSGGRLRRIRRLLGPDLCSAACPSEVVRLQVAKYGIPVGSGAASCAQVPLSAGRIDIVDRRFVEAAHRLGVPVHVWTIDDRAEMERLLDLGVDGLMTDVPHVLKEVLEDRGQWS